MRTEEQKLDIHYYYAYYLKRKTAYNELLNKLDNALLTRATTRGLPPTITAKTSIYHNSFLPKTVRELKLNTNNLKI